MRSILARLCFLLMVIIVAIAQSPVYADEYSSTLHGPLGLNTVPSARMDEAGTIRLGVSTLDPYAHGFIGFQIADPLYINIRQTAEGTDLNADPDRLYPGIDFKLRLLKESQFRPAIVVGLQSAIGHKRMAGEYIALSKRYNDFDFTAGLGWGRYGSAGHFDNPLKGVLGHFGKNRNLDGEMPNEPANWFTGEQIGLFGGIEYFTPIKGLSLKADYGADRFEAEKAAFNYDTPAPWSIGANYQPAPWVNLGLALQGTDKIMGRLALNTNLKDWRDRNARAEYPQPMRAFRTGIANSSAMEISAQKENILLQHASLDTYSAQARLALEPQTSAPHQIGRAAVHISNHAGPAIEEFTIIPSRLGLQGPSIKLMRKDFEKALAHHQGSPEEIWHNAAFDTTSKHPLTRLDRGYQHFLDFKEYSFTLDNRISLAEEDSGILYRTSFIAEKLATDFFGFIDAGLAVRFNLADNLNRITNIRPRSILPVRSDVDIFAQRTVAIDKAYNAFTHSFRPDLHLALVGGYLEEMYAGLGGELLYRPFGSRWALGAEAWQSFKRDPFTDMNLGLNGDHVLTTHVNAWYDLPRYDLTVKAQVGRYLAEDLGGTLSLQKHFKNGAKLEGFITLTDSADFDLFGGTTHNHHGIRLSLPLGGFKYIPPNARVDVRAEPLGRDIGQAIESPLPLYDLTEPFSYDHLTQNWHQIVPAKP